MKLELLSPAKINLLLKILGRRPDGFHEIITVMQTVSLADEITIITGTASTTVRGDRPDFPDDEDNIIHGAIQGFQEISGIQDGIQVRVKKRIPVAAGLGGGSSNAGTVLRALNQHYEEPLNFQSLSELAGTLGSDVPFFLTGGTALASGRGETITVLPELDKVSIVLINPGFAVSTAHIYQKLKIGLTTPETALNILPVFSLGTRWSNDLINSMENDLEDVVMDAYPEIRQIKYWLMERNAGKVLVSGSGGTVFGLFMDPDDAREVGSVAKTRFEWVSVEETQNSSFI